MQVKSIAECSKEFCNTFDLPLVVIKTFVLSIFELWFYTGFTISILWVISRKNLLLLFLVNKDADQTPNVCNLIRFFVTSCLERILAINVTSKTCLASLCSLRDILKVTKDRFSGFKTKVAFLLTFYK